MSPDEINRILPINAAHSVDDDECVYDFSIVSSIGSNHAGWLHLAELDGTLTAMPEGPSKARAVKLVKLLHAWFSNAEERLVEMQARREREKYALIERVTEATATIGRRE